MIVLLNFILLHFEVITSQSQTHEGNLRFWR